LRKKVRHEQRVPGNGARLVATAIIAGNPSPRARCDRFEGVGASEGPSREGKSAALRRPVKPSQGLVLWWTDAATIPRTSFENIKRFSWPDSKKSTGCSNLPDLQAKGSFGNGKS
jgi:hypothetical protein